MLGRFAELTIPAYVVQATADHFVSEDQQQEFVAFAAEHRSVERFPGYSHSGWTYDEARPVLERTREFLLASLRPASLG